MDACITVQLSDAFHYVTSAVDEQALSTKFCDSPISYCSNSMEKSSVVQFYTKPLLLLFDVVISLLAC